jgi:hypothetical protein
MLAYLGILGGIFAFFSYFPYIRDIFRLKTKPERASWLIWVVLTTMGFFSNLAVGATDSLWLPGIQSFGVFLIFILSFRYGYGGLLKRDILVLLAAALTLLVWYFTSEPLIALYLVILIDGMGGALTVVKTYHHPESETISAWILCGLGGLCAFLSVGTFDIFLLSYPFYIMLINFLVVLAIFLGKKKQLSKASLG